MAILDDLTGRHTPAAFGQSPTASTSIKKHGTSAAYFNGSAGVQVASHSDFALGSINGYATIHGWFRTGASAYLYIDNKTYPTYIRMLSAGTLSFQWGFNGRIFNFGWSSGPDFRDNAWHHVAMTIAPSGGNVWINCYVDGWLRRHFLDDYPNNDPAQGTLYFGSTSQGAARLTGYMDSWEIINGTALWSGGTEGTDVFDHNALTQPTVTTNDVLIMNFNETYHKISGVVSDDAVIRVYDENWVFQKSQAVSAGAYEVDELQPQNDLKVICTKSSDNAMISYDLVQAIEY